MGEKDGKDTKDIKDAARERGNGINSPCYNRGQLVTSLS